MCATPPVGDVAHRRETKTDHLVERLQHPLNDEAANIDTKLHPDLGRATEVVTDQHTRFRVLPGRTEH